MDRLILMRHGRAEPDSATGDDFDRALVPGGVRQAQVAGATLADMGFRPDIALVSPAVRAVQTAGLIARAQRNFPTATAAVFLFDHNGRPAYDGLFFPERDD